VVPPWEISPLRARPPGRRTEAAEPNPFTRFQLVFESRFEKFRHGYRRILELCIEHAGVFIILFFVLSMGSAALLYRFLAKIFSPPLTAASSKLHIRRAPERALRTPLLCATASTTPSARSFRRTNWSPSSITSVCPYSSINLSYSNSAPVGPGDADIQVFSLAEHHHPTEGYVGRLREELPRRFPGTEFYTLPSTW